MTPTGLRVRKRPRLRFVPRPVPGVWTEVHRAAERHHDAMARAFRSSMDEAARALSQSKLEGALRAGNWRAAVGQFNRSLVRAAYEERVAPLEYAVMADAARAGLPTLPGFTAKQAPKPGELVVGGFFDLANPEAIRAASKNAATMVTNVTLATQAALREIVKQAQRQGLSVPGQAAEIARRLRRGVGLTRPQIIALENLTATWTGAGLSRSAVASNRAKARERMITYRSKVIARHETQLAANTGVNELWREAIDQKLIPWKVKREWITQPPLNEMNPCRICRPMDGQKRAMGELFWSPYNGATALFAPIHVQCMCVVVLALD